MWFLSVLVVLVNLLYVYASLPQQVIIGEESAAAIMLSKEWLFYIILGATAIINALVYLFRKMLPAAEDLRAWFHGLVITINIFFVISMHAINVSNSAELFDHTRVPYIVSGSLGLILLWAIFWPFYLLYQKFFLKQVV